MADSLTGRPVVRVPAGRPAVEDAARDAVGDADVTVAGVGPTGLGSLDPLVTATADGRTALYGQCTPERAADVAAALAADPTAGGVAAESTGDEAPTAVVEHDPDAATFPVPADTLLDVGTRRLLAGCGWHRPTEPADHAAAGGFVDADSDTVLDAAADLRGRGWGDWRHDEPVAPTWRDVRDGGALAADAGDAASGNRADGDAAVVVNAHGNPADALLLEGVPFGPLEGAALLARAVDADRVVVYASEADETALERARAAADAYPDASFEVVAGPAVYRAAEPTMALEAIEGNHRLEARLRHPGHVPTLDESPALVHTARTLTALADKVRAGERENGHRAGGRERGNSDSDRHGGRGRGNSDSDRHGDHETAAPTRLVTVAGDVETPATVELAATATLDAALAAVETTGAVKAAAVGGRFGGLTSSLAVAAAPDALADADLGTEGVVELLAEDRCVVEFVGRRARWAADANCGRCVPCREGTTQLTELLRDVYDGDYDPAAIEELLRVMDATSVCGFGPGAARPTRTAIAAFEAEFRAHADGRCPAGACFDRAEAGPREVAR